MSKFYFRLTVYFCLIIIFLGIELCCGSIFVNIILAQDDCAQNITGSERNTANSQQNIVTKNHPLTLYSTTQFNQIETVPITPSDETYKSYRNAPTPKLNPNPTITGTQNIINPTKNNFRNDNKNTSKVKPNNKIRLAAVSSIDEDDRIMPAAPMPASKSNTPTNSSRKDTIDNAAANTKRKFDYNSSNSSGDFNRNNVTNIPNGTPPSPQNDQTPEHEHEYEQDNKTAEQQNRQPNIDPYHPPVKTASFNGVVPGNTSVKSVVELWGKPVQETMKGGELAHLYSFKELNHVEVTYDKNKIVKSIVVRLDELYPENLVREEFETELLKSRPVLIPDETGKIIGELFPEKGVVFLFAGSKNGGMFQVRQIGIEPVISEPFVLRAEATLNDQPSESYRDLIDAIRINRTDAKAYWLLAKIELLKGATDTAIINIQKAIHYDERKPAYHLTLAQILSRMNRVEDAKLYLEETIAICERFPTDKARAHCLLGDFYRTGQAPDCEEAYKHHSTAIEIANQLTDHPNPAVRQTAKDILFEARLAVAKDIAWGRWKSKERAIENWLANAEAITTDPEMIATRRFSSEYPLKLAICELACQVGINNENDIEPYVKGVIQAGERLLSNTSDPISLQKLQWDISLAIYDAVQIYQLREKYEFALDYGELAAEYMESGIKGRTNDSDLYLVARLYFRLGTIHALGNKNHRAAIEWFNKAKPIFEKLFPKINPEELGRFGESLVSMGVSYWLTNQRDEAIKLTERGLRQIERGAKLGFVKESAFAIPYSNLMNMYNELGNVERAKHYYNLSNTLKYSEQKR
ncbi:MAG: hypothetical protein LBP59_18020 [Planctomycetaceae bacterium]|jgi:tetratricopeptide (TPR) repeat protein|nr:hypothetical protein [Planctomycetaceae bacterium]